MHWLVNLLEVHLGIKFACGKLKNGLNFGKDNQITCIKGGLYTILSLSRHGFGNTFFFFYMTYTHMHSHVEYTHGRYTSNPKRTLSHPKGPSTLFNWTGPLNTVSKVTISH